MREINEAKCSCGGTVSRVEQTPEEAKEYDCGRGCCGVSLECDKCRTRFVIGLSSPEWTGD